MPDESKYVLRHEWIDRNGKIYSHIKDVDNKHVNLHNDLKLIVTTLINSNEVNNKTSEKMSTSLESIDGKMDNYNDRMKDVEYTVETTVKRIDGIEQSVTERKKGNTQIIVAVITSLATILGGATWLAQLF